MAGEKSVCAEGVSFECCAEDLICESLIYVVREKIRANGEEYLSCWMMAKTSCKSNGAQQM